jgi:hypothetical protein
VLLALQLLQAVPVVAAVLRTPTKARQPPPLLALAALELDHLLGLPVENLV